MIPLHRGMRAVLLRRYKRFLADIRFPGGEEALAHCPNSGSMEGCWRPGAPCWVTPAENSRRRTSYTLEAVEMEDGWVLVNTHRANELAARALESGEVPGLAEVSAVEREVLLPGRRSRMDFRLRTPRGVVWLEVKSVTWWRPERDAVVFPDAVTERGRRHLEALREIAARGEGAALLLMVNRPGGACFLPAWDKDPRWGEELLGCVAGGVRVVALRTIFRPPALLPPAQVPLGDLEPW